MFFAGSGVHPGYHQQCDLGTFKRQPVVLKDERRTLNIERPTSNEKQALNTPAR
jgi:hypothetical protein